MYCQVLTVIAELLIQFANLNSVRTYIPMSFSKTLTKNGEFSLFDQTGTTNLQVQPQFPTVETLSTSVTVEQSQNTSPQASNNRLSAVSTVEVAVAGAVGLLIMVVGSLLVIRRAQFRYSSEQSEKVLTHPPAPVISAESF